MMPYIAPVYFAIFVLASQFVLVNVVVAVLMKQLEEAKTVVTEDDDNDMYSERSFQFNNNNEEDKYKLDQLSLNEDDPLLVASNRGSSIGHFSMKTNAGSDGRFDNFEDSPAHYKQYLQLSFRDLSENEVDTLKNAKINTNTSDNNFNSGVNILDVDTTLKDISQKIETENKGSRLLNISQNDVLKTPKKGILKCSKSLNPSDFRSDKFSLATSDTREDRPKSSNLENKRKLIVYDDYFTSKSCSESLSTPELQKKDSQNQANFISETDANINVDNINEFGNDIRKKEKDKKNNSPLKSSMETQSFSQTNLGNVQETTDQNSQEVPFIRPNNDLTNALFEKTASVKKKIKSDNDTKILDDSFYEGNSEENVQLNKPSTSKLVEPNRVEQKTIEIDIQTNSAVTDLQDQTKRQSSNNLGLESIQENIKPFDVVSTKTKIKKTL